MNFNDAVFDAINKSGQCRLADGTILTDTIDADTLRKGISINTVIFNVDGGFTIALEATPDYFGGHVLEVDVYGEEYELEYGGMQGEFRFGGEGREL